VQPLTAASLVADNSFSVLLRAQRHRAAISQDELAARSGISARTVRNLEANRVRTPRDTTAQLLADGLGLTGPERTQFVGAARGASVPPSEMTLLSSTTGPALVPREVPAQLPLDVRGFVGRDDQLTRLDAIFAEAGQDPTAAVVTTVSGTAGVGKTALAVHWAHRVAERFSDGQLYLNLRGFAPDGPAVDPGEAVRRFLDALGVPAQRIPPGVDAQASLYRSELAGRRVLIILDNARDADQVRPLLPGTPTAMVVVTSRNQLTSLVAAEGAQPLALDLLSEAEARELFARRLGNDRVAAEPDAVEEIIARCARLPLALAIVAGRAAIHPDFSLAVLAAELRDASDRLDALTGDDATTDLRVVFSWSYNTLSPRAARLFCLLGLHPGPDLSAPAAASLGGFSRRRVRSLLAELTRAHLVAEHSPGRYTFHDLLRAYAVDLARINDGDGQCDAPIHRMLDHYLHTAYRADRLLYPNRDPITLAPPQPGTLPEDLAGHGQALAWLTDEHSVLLAAVEYAARAGLDIHTWQLVWILTDFLDRRGHWNDQATTQLLALAAARRLGDVSKEARAHRRIARACIQLSRYDDAHTHLRNALGLYRQRGDLAGQADTHLDLAMMWEPQDRRTEALDHSQQALELYRAAGHQPGQANALNAVGWYNAQLGDHRQALACCQRALTLHENLGDRPGRAHTWDSLGYAYHHLGRHTQAAICYEQALHLFRDLGDRYYESIIHSHLGDTHLAAGDPDAARDAWQYAMAILDDLDHPDASRVRARLDRLDSSGMPAGD
jgi:tetratricopeptide (TPR) repeat protein/transcriptional regulator with XRE-family HTH domain